MKVKDVIEKLSKYNPEDDIYVWEHEQSAGYWYTRPAEDVYSEEDEPTIVVIR